MTVFSELHFAQYCVTPNTVIKKKKKVKREQLSNLAKNFFLLMFCAMMYDEGKLSFGIWLFFDGKIGGPKISHNA